MSNSWVGFEVEVDEGEISRTVAGIRRRHLAALDRAGNRIADQMITRIRELTSNWRHKPILAREVDTSGGLVSAAVDIKSDVFHWLDKGTRSYIIRPKPGGVLAFQRYRAKTRVGSLHSGGGGAYGPIIYTRKPVMHPGIKPRKFTEALNQEAARYGPLFIREELDRA